MRLPLSGGSSTELSPANASHHHTPLKFEEPVVAGVPTGRALPTSPTIERFGADPPELAEALTQMSQQWETMERTGPAPAKPRNGVGGAVSLPIAINRNAHRHAAFARSRSSIVD